MARLCVGVAVWMYTCLREKERESAFAPCFVYGSAAVLYIAIVFWSRISADNATLEPIHKIVPNWMLPLNSRKRGGIDVHLATQTDFTKLREKYSLKYIFPYILNLKHIAVTIGITILYIVTMLKRIIFYGSCMHRSYGSIFMESFLDNEYLI